jgi:hypothetical protein
VVEVFPGPQLRRALDGFDVESAVGGAFAGAEGYTFDDVERDGRPGYRIEVPFRDHRDAVPLLVDGATVAGERVVLFSSFELEELRGDRGWRLEAEINPIGRIVSGGAAEPTALEQLVAAAGLPGSGSGLDLSISLPGAVVSSNADRVDGGTATWVLDRPEAPTRLFLRTEPRPLLNPAQLVAALAAAAVAVGAVLALVGRRTYQRTEGDRNRRRHERHGVRRTPGDPWAPPPGGAPSAAPAAAPRAAPAATPPTAGNGPPGGGAVPPPTLPPLGPQPPPEPPPGPPPPAPPPPPPPAPGPPPG